MEPIRYGERLNAFYRSQGFPPYQWSVYETAPLAPLTKPLRQCRVALLTSGGVSCKNTPPFNPLARNDLRVDAIPQETPADFFVINDAYYNHQDADRDINCIFPLERLGELASEGVIGEVAAHHYSGFMGRTYTRTAVLNEATPALAHRLKQERVDIFVLVPA